MPEGTIYIASGVILIGGWSIILKVMGDSRYGGYAVYGWLAVSMVITAYLSRIIP